MQTAAITKLNGEITNSNNNPYIQVVGQFLIGHLDKNPQDAEKILTADKTIGKSLEVMQSEASKKKVGNCAVLTDQEGFGIVLKYFGIDGMPAAAAPAPIPTAPAVVTSVSSGSKFDVKLDDFL